MAHNDNNVYGMLNDKVSTLKGVQLRMWYIYFVARYKVNDCRKFSFATVFKAGDDMIIKRNSSIWIPYNEKVFPWSNLQVIFLYN